MVPKFKRGSWHVRPRKLELASPDHNLDGLKNISSLIEVYKIGYAELLNEEFDYAICAFLHNKHYHTTNRRVLDHIESYKARVLKETPSMAYEIDWNNFRYFDYDLVGEAFCTKLYLASDMDLRKTLEKCISLTSVLHVDSIVRAVRNPNF